MHFYPASQDRRKVWNFKGGSGNLKPLDRSQEKILHSFLPKSGGVGKRLPFRFRRPCIKHHLICHGKLYGENWYWLFMFIPCPLNPLNGFPYQRPRLILTWYMQHTMCRLKSRLNSEKLSIKTYASKILSFTRKYVFVKASRSISELLTQNTDLNLREFRTNPTSGIILRL